jgi:uncharacterized protein (TIGR00290 family)
MTKAVFNWSGGKDSALALWSAQQTGVFDIRCLLTTLSETHLRISMHGVREALLDRQAAAIGLPLHKIFLPEDAGMETYNAKMSQAMHDLSLQGIRTGLFGDIFLEDLRAFREKALEAVGWNAVFPIWKRPSRELLLDFIDQGFKAILVCVNEACLDPSFAGRLIDRSLLDDLPGNVDPCGENGEFHSFVFDGPLFREPVAFHKGEVVHRRYPAAAAYETGFYFCDLLPGNV